MDFIAVVIDAIIDCAVRAASCVKCTEPLEDVIAQCLREKIGMGEEIQQPVSIYGINKIV